MKFFPPEYLRPNIAPLNITYNSPMDYSSKDVLTIIYKDLDTNQKLVYEIEEPEIEIYIVKPEYRDYSHMRDWFEMSKCNKYKVKYRSRWFEASKLLKLKDGNEAKKSPYLFGIDIPIENYYLIHFINEYDSNKENILSLGALDIENDIIQCDGFPSYGETPINAVTYINMEFNQVYTLWLAKDNLPNLPTNHPQYKKTEDMREKFYKQVDVIKNNPSIITDMCNERFTELYGEMEYNLIAYDSEEKLLEDLMMIIHSTDNDYIGIWNLPYDIGNILERPKVLGMEISSLICDERFRHKNIQFKEDRNPVTHKRSHTCITSTIPTFVDDMVQYTGIRAGKGGKLPSSKLNFVAQLELEDEKYDYSEVSDIKHLFYDDLTKFLLYNIKDVLLMVGISRQTNDMSNMYSRMTQMMVFPYQSFTSTKVVWYSIINFFISYKNGLTFGINRNKGNKDKRVIDYIGMLNNNSEYLSSDIETDIGLLLDYEEEDEDEEDVKFPGAYVMNTLHMESTGEMIMGKPAKYVHRNVGDLDVTSEYPNAVRSCNVSNETLVAKIFLEEEESVNIEIPEGFVFRGDDEIKYKVNKSNILLETYTQDTTNFGSIFLDLPTTVDILYGIGDLISSRA